MTNRIDRRGIVAMLLVALLSTLFAVVVTVPSLGQATRHLVIFTGASNCGGYGTATNPISPDTGVTYSRYVTGVQWARNNGGTIGGNYNNWIGFQNSSAYGPEVGFMNVLQAADPGKLYAAISCSVGGSSIDEWLPARNKYWPVLVDQLTKAINRIVLAGEIPEVAACVTMIGENGATATWPYLHPTLPEYSDKVRTFVSSLRAVTRPDLPVVQGRIGDFYLETQIGDARNAALYRRAQAGGPNDSPKATLSIPVAAHWWAGGAYFPDFIAGGDTNIVCVDTDGLPPRFTPNDIHFSSDGYCGMGERMAFAFLAFLGL